MPSSTVSSADQVGELVACLQQRGQIDAAVDAKTAGDVLFEGREQPVHGLRRAGRDAGRAF